MLFNGRFTVSNLIISLEALVIPYLSISSSTRYKLLIECSNLLKWLPLLRRVGIYEMTQWSKVAVWLLERIAYIFTLIPKFLILQPSHLVGPVFSYLTAQAGTMSNLMVSTRVHTIVIITGKVEKKAVYSRIIQKSLIFFISKSISLCNWR